MDVFNPKILDASIRDVASCLSDTQKVDLLLYALAAIPLPPLPSSSSSSTSTSSSAPSSRAPPGYTKTAAGAGRTSASASASASPSTSYTSIGYGLSYTYNTYPHSTSAHSGYAYAPASPAHTLLENGIASVLQVRALPPPTVARARVLRARARMRMRVGISSQYGAGSNTERGEGGEGEWVKGVRDDLHAALEADPTNKDARTLLATLDGDAQTQSESNERERERDAGDVRNNEDGDEDERGREVGDDEDMHMQIEEERDVEVEVPPVQVQASRGPTGAEKILSLMASPTLVHPPKAQILSSRPSASTSMPTAAVASGSTSGARTSIPSRPPILHTPSSYSSAASHASTSTSTPSTMPPPASHTATHAHSHAAPTPAATSSSSYRTHAPAVHIPPTRLSAEVWRLVGTHLSRRDLANVLYLRHPLALVAAERLAADVEVWFGSGGPSGAAGEWDGVELARRRARPEKGRGVAEDGFGDYSDRDRDAEYEDVDMDRERDRDRDREDERPRGGRRRRDTRGSSEDLDEEEERKDDARRAMRTAHLLARVIRDTVFASRVRTLRVYFGPVESNTRPGPSSRTSTSRRRRSSKAEDASPDVAFQTGMLANALPSLLHLRNVHISGGADAMMPVLRILQRRAPKLTGLSLTSPDSPPDLSFLDLRRLVHFSYTITGPNGVNTPPASSSALQRVLAGAQGTLKSVALLNSYAAVGYLQPQPTQSATGTTYTYNSSPPIAAAAAAAASASYTGPIGHQQLLHPQPPAQSNGNSVTTASGSGAGYSRHGQAQQQPGQYPQYPLTHPYAPSPHQHALPSHARSLAPHPHSAHAHSAQTHASAMMSVHALAGGSGGTSSSHVGPASSGPAGGMMPQQQQQQQREQGYRPRIAPAPPAGYTPSVVPSNVHGGGGPPQPAPAPAPVPLWVFPTGALSIGNLTRIHFAGAIPAGSRVFADILAHGRHLETLDIECAPLECTDVAQQFLDAASGSNSSSFRSSSSSDGSALPLLTNFSFTVSSLSRRYADNSGPGAGTALFPAIAELLRGRRTLRTLALVVAPQANASVEAQMHTAVGFDASVWGVLPSLQGSLRGVRMTYPADLAAGLAGWLVPRSVRALGIVMGESGPLKSGGADGSWTPGSERRSPSSRDWDRESDRDVRGDKQRAYREALQFLNALKSSMPPGLRFISLPDSLLSILPPSDRDSSASVSSSTTAATLVVEHGFPSVRVVRMGAFYWTVSRKTLHGSTPGYSSSGGSYSARDPSAPPSYESHMYDDRNPASGANSRGEKEVVEMEKWPRHRVLHHTSEWLAWYGCEDAVVRDVSGFDA